MGMQVCLQDPNFNSLGCITRRGIAGSYLALDLIFLRKLNTVSHSGYTILHSNQQYILANICNVLILFISNALKSYLNKQKYYGKRVVLRKMLHLTEVVRG